MEDTLAYHIEALIFSAENSIELVEIQNCINQAFHSTLSKDKISGLIGKIEEKYAQKEYVFELVKISGGFRFFTKKEYAPTLSILFQQKNQKKLSTAALETLSIIVYKQPVTKSQIEEIRGVNCDYSIQKLLEKELIQIDGKSEGPGRPLIYSTSKQFMDYFNLDTLDQLPQIRDMAVDITA